MMEKEKLTIPNFPGIAISDFTRMVKEVTDKKGKSVMISATDKGGLMHLTLKKKHIAVISLKTGDLVWDKGEPDG